jgi:predicted dehydrogenase
MNNKRNHKPNTIKLRVAHIGAGRMGRRWVGALAKSNLVTLTTIVDHGSGEAQKLVAQVPGCRATTDIKSVLQDSAVDALIVSTPHRYLAEISNIALKSGKHVLCEKPGARTSAEIKRNIVLSKKMGLTYMIGYNHRFHDGFLKARSEYDKGTIGEVVFIRARYGFGGREGYNTEWRLNPKQSGGGHLIDQGVHMIDLALSYIGTPKTVQGVRSDTFWKKGAEDNAFVLLQGKQKQMASIHTSLTQWKPMHSFEIYGTKGYLEVQGLGMKYGNGEKLVIGIRSKDFSAPVKEKTIECNSVADDSLALELNEFVSAIKAKREPIPSPLDAYETLKVVESVYKNNTLKS